MAGLIISPRGQSTATPAAATPITPQMLQALAKALQQPPTPGLPPPTPPVTVQNTGGSPPSGPGGAVGSAIGGAVGNAPNFSGLAQPQSAGAPSSTNLPPMPSPTPVNAPPAIAPGDQTLPSTMTQSATAADAGNGPNTPGFWERINKAMQAQQVPNGYRGAMGEMIPNG